MESVVIALLGRAIVLIPNSGDAWPKDVKNALCSLSNTWDGIADVLVPTDVNGMTLSIFKTLIRAFDPDHIYCYLTAQSKAGCWWVPHNTVQPSLYRRSGAGGKVWGLLCAQH